MIFLGSITGSSLKKATNPRRGIDGCIVYGHGIFSAGEKDFQDAFMKMVDVESRCREEYFVLLEERLRNQR